MSSTTPSKGALRQIRQDIKEIKKSAEVSFGRLTPLQGFGISLAAGLTGTMLFEVARIYYEKKQGTAGTTAARISKAS